MAQNFSFLENSVHKDMWPYLRNPLHQNSRLRYANFMFPHFWNIIKLLFPFKYPMNPATLILGGMLTYMCIWSGHTSPSMISAPFHWHNFLSISRISNLFSSKNTFRLYLGANTKWYLQFILYVLNCLRWYLALALWYPPIVYLATDKSSSIVHNRSFLSVSSA